MVEPEERSAAGVPFQDDLAYLVLLSERLLDLVPDGIAVVDEQLRVRAANSAFALLLGVDSREAVVGRSLADTPIPAAPVPDGSGRTLEDVLREVAESGRTITVAGVPLAAPGSTAETWEVCGAGWDTEDPAFRRILLRLRRTPRTREEASSGALLEEKDEQIFRLAARAERLLERLPVGACVLDSALRVRAMNRRLQEMLDRSFRAEGPGDRHLFAVVPELRDDDFLERLQRCRDSAEPLHGTLSVAGSGEIPLEIEVEVQPVAGPDRHVGELLVLLHEVRGARAPTTSGAGGAEAIPCGPEEILAPENLERWPAPATRRVLVVERDAWMRALVSDTLRGAGFQELTVVESGGDAHDTGSFGAVLIGVDSDPDDARAFVRQVAEEHPRLPVIGVTQRQPESVREFLDPLRLCGILGTDAPAGLGDTLRGLFRIPAVLPPAGTEMAEPQRVLDVVLLGASEADVPVLRLLYRAQHVHVSMVYDPDPAAFGLALARDLGIPAMSGELSLTLGKPPDAVVLARVDLAHRLHALGLADVPRVALDEVERFLVDPAPFLSGDRPAPPPPAPESPSPLPPDRSLPPTLGALVTAAVRPRGEAASTGASPLPPDEDTDPEVGAMLGAVDLLLDFDRVAARVLETACRSCRAESGSLMVLRPDGRELVIVASTGLSDVVVRTTRQRVGEGVAGRVAATGKPLLLAGRIEDDPIEHEWDDPDEIRSAVCVPVVAEERVIGVINLNADPDGETFGGRELRAMTRFGRRVGPVLDRSLMIRRQRYQSFGQSVRAELEAIVATQSDPLARLARGAERLVQVLGVDTCAVWALDVERGRLLRRARAGSAEASREDGESVPVGKGLVGRVARHGRPLAIRKGADGTRERTGTLVEAAAVPMGHGTDLVGVLAVESAVGAPFDDERLEVLSSSLSVLGGEVVKVRERSADDGRAIAVGAPEAVSARTGQARFIAFSACAVLDSDIATARFLAPGAPPGSRRLDDFRMVAAHGAPLPSGGVPLAELDTYLAREVVASGLPLRDVDLPHDETGPLLERASVSSALGIPLVSGASGLVGILVVYRTAGRDGARGGFGDEEVEMAGGLADQAVGSLQRPGEGEEPAEAREGGAE